MEDGAGESAFVPIKDQLFVLTRSLPLDRNPVAVYLAGLGTDESRRAMRDALNVIADLVSAGNPDTLTGRLRPVGCGYQRR